MKQLWVRLVNLSVGCICVLSLSSMAEEGGRGADNRPPHGGAMPPPEATAACVDKALGDEVSFVTPRGDTISATCKQMREGLVAVPTHPPKGSEHSAEKPGRSEQSQQP